MRVLRCSFDVMVDASESLSLTLITRSATVCWRLVISAICCSIRLFDSWLDSAKVAIIFICWAMISSNLDILIDLAESSDDVDFANGYAGVSCQFSCDSNMLMRASSCCS